jgi:PAS domain S-box-containing protein
MPELPPRPSKDPGTSKTSEEAAAKEISAGYSALAGLETELSGVRLQIEQRQQELNAAKAELQALHDASPRERQKRNYPVGDRSAEILESINDAFYALDADLTFVYTNSKALEIWRIPGVNLIGREFWDVFPTARNSDSGNMHLQAMAERNPVRYETFSPVLHSWIDVSIYPDSGGGLSVYFRDISERKATEEALRESEAHLRIMMETATDYAIISTNRNGIIDGWSAGAELIFGYIASEAIGMSADIIFTPEDVASGVPDREMGTARTKGWAVDERWHLRRDGTRFYMSGVMRPILNPDLRGYVKVARDMTDQQKAAERLRISEERLRIALTAAEMGTWDWDIQSNHCVWNDQHYMMLGLQPIEGATTPESLFEHAHPEDRDTMRHILDQALSHTGIFNTRFRIVRADTGAVRWMQGYGRVIGTVGAVPVRMVGVLYDITESQDLEQQKDQFIAIASHELRTPVTAMKAYAEVLQDVLRKSGADRSFQLMRKLDGQINRLANLVRDLLDVTRIRDRRLELRRERFDLGGLLLEVADEMSHLGPPRIELQMEHATPVLADRERIRQVLTNLLSNAVRYSPEEASVVISLHLHRHEVLVCVRDFGAGLAPEFRSQVFERYFRAGTHQDNSFPGLGLGLYIAAEIVRWHEGRIWVENPEPAGAMFCFTLPSTA